MSSGLARLGEEADAERVVIQPAKRRVAVLRFIRAARERLLLSIFRCDDLEVLAALGEAAARGVKVEALLTGRAKGWGKRLSPLAACLERMGIPVARFPKGVPKYHAKYMTADGRRAWIGTMNFTRKSFRKTSDFVLETGDSEIVTGLEALFRGDRRGGVCDARVGGRLILGPEDSRTRIETLLCEARRTIRIMDHKLSDPGILAILRERQRHGVAVEIARGEGPGGLLPHGRLLVIDGKVAIFGSLALSAKSLDERRELAVTVERADLVAKLERQFSLDETNQTAPKEWAA